jgi:hypothetical protein
MDVAALVLWVATALGGIVMAVMWLAGGGPAQHRDGTSRISPARLGGHAGLAATGLVLWIVYAATDEAVVGWLAFAALPVVALLGVLMLVTWLAVRGAAVTGARPAEQRFPVVVVVAHGVAAVLTVVAVLVAVAS